MADIDNVELIRSMDPQNMYNAVFDMPEHIIEGIRLGHLWRIDPDEFSEIRNIVVVGMGGSAIAGDLCYSLLRSQLLVPFSVVRGHVLPEYVDDETLVIASSYSGNTDETIAAVEDALLRKAMLVAFTTGGLLKEICDLNQIPLGDLPTGIQPRAALGYSFTMMLLFLERIGLAPGAEDQLKQLTAGLQRYREVYIEDNASEQNTAKNLARRLQGKISIIYTGPSLTDSVGVRLKGQICENSKQLAFVNQFSEFNHNELVGWSPLVEAHLEHLIVIILRDAEDTPQIRTRMNIVRDIIKERGVDVIEMHTKGNSRLERMFSLVQLGDFISYYLAVLNDVDPTPVAVIEELKEKLAAANLPRV
ncbi:MAG: bifunctional phosphoglucose/phosphomannose isomerase [bacterium]